jgi:hypothetical protein
MSLSYPLARVSLARSLAAFFEQGVRVSCLILLAAIFGSEAVQIVLCQQVGQARCYDEHSLALQNFANRVTTHHLRHHEASASLVSSPRTMPAYPKPMGWWSPTPGISQGFCFRRTIGRPMLAKRDVLF